MPSDSRFSGPKSSMSTSVPGTRQSAAVLLPGLVFAASLLSGRGAVPGGDPAGLTRPTAQVMTGQFMPLSGPTNPAPRSLTLVFPEPQMRWGNSVTGAFDADGDGHGDILLGTRRASNLPGVHNAFMILPGQTGGIRREPWLTHGDPEGIRGVPDRKSVV